MIGAAARRAGVTVKAMRYYERIGLIPAAGRNAVNYRIFPGEVVERLVFIRGAQGLGLSLAEIAEILAVHDRGEWSCGEVGKSLAHKVAAIDEKIAELETLKGELLAIKEQLPKSPRRQTADICPIINAALAAPRH